MRARSRPHSRLRSTSRPTHEASDEEQGRRLVALLLSAHGVKPLQPNGGGGGVLLLR